MSTDELIAACVAAPDDDAPRLVWADAVGGERGELVVVQCMLARGGVPPQESARLRQRQRELLAQHGVAWSGLQDIGYDATFRRGFVEAACIPYERFVAQADEIFTRAPLLRSLLPSGFQQEPCERVRELLGSPAVARLTGMNMHDIQTVSTTIIPPDLPEGEPFYAEDYDVHSEVTNYGAEVIGDIAQHLHHVRAFGTYKSGLAPVLHRAGLANVERLYVSEPCTTEQLLAVFSTMPRLYALELYDDFDLVAILPRLPPAIRELSIRIRTEYLPALRSMPCLASLVRLRLATSEYRMELCDLSLFSAMPKLHSLIVNVPICRDQAQEREAVEQLLSLPMPALRELAPFDDMAPANARRMLEVLGPQLERVDLGANPALHGDRTLDTLVAGEIVRGERVGFISSLAVGGDAPEPWNRDNELYLRN